VQRKLPFTRPDDRSPLRFSFRYLDTTHPAFDVRTRGGDYFRVLIARLKELSAFSLAQFRTARIGTLRIHPIDFADPRVSVRTFNLPAHSEADDNAWQFALSANEHGRVHGFLIDDTFYVRWLDPDHRLYPGN